MKVFCVPGISGLVSSNCILGIAVPVMVALTVVSVVGAVVSTTEAWCRWPSVGLDAAIMRPRSSGGDVIIGGSVIGGPVTIVGLETDELDLGGLW